MKSEQFKITSVSKSATAKLGLKPEYHQLDVTVEESISKFVKFIKNHHGGVDVLVNNAGVACRSNSAAQFVEQTQVCLATNFFGPLALCRAVFPLLRPHARVVHLTSCEGHLSKIPGQAVRDRFRDPTLTLESLSQLVKEFLGAVKSGTYNESGWGSSAYRVSKVALCALTFLQQRQFDRDPRPDMVVNSVHPGFCATNITLYRGPLSAEEGADAPTYLALLPPNISQPKGQFVWKDRTVVSWAEPLKERC